MAGCNSRNSKKMTFRNILISPLGQLRAAWIRWQQPPPHSTLPHVCNLLRFCGLLPLRRDDNGNRRVGNLLLLLALLFMALTVTVDLYYERHDLVMLGDDLVILLGLYLIWVKHLIFRQHADSLQSLVLEFDALHHSNAAWAHTQLQNGALTDDELQAGHDVLELQRVFYIVESTALFGYGMLGASLIIALCLHPLVTHEPLPMRCHYPFALQQRKHWHPIIYLLQCVHLAYEISAVLLIENLACSFCTQITVNLRILCVRLRTLSAAATRQRDDDGGILWRQLRYIVHRHQQIISLVDRINDCLYWGHLAQMSASTFMICLTALETLLAQDQPLVAIKFEVYMLTAFMHLFYWCLMGNIIYFDSMEVANAAFELRRWYYATPALQLNLMFIIQRAQKPLQLQPKPLFAFNFATFANILSTSYSYFTLLRTMIE